MDQRAAPAWALVATVCLSGLAQAQDNTLPKVEVTGSHIRRLEDDSISPLQVLERADIERSGAKSVYEVLASLVPNAVGQKDESAGGSFSGGASSATLRGLGYNATLVLLNSRRLAPYPLAADGTTLFTNIDTLPLEAIERIEILKGGAAAVYGSEAIAGVINIITRPGFEGVHLRAQADRSATSGRFTSRTAGLSAGHGNYAADGFNLFGTLDLYQRDKVMWRDVLQYVNPLYFEKFPSLGSFSSYSTPGNLIGSAKAGPVAGCASELLINGLCRYDRYQRFQAMPDGRRVNAYSRAQWRLGGGTEAFAEALFADTRTTYLFPYLPYGKGLGQTQWQVPSTGEVKTFTYRGLPAGHPLNNTGEADLELRYRFADSTAQSELHTRQYRALGGLRGRWREFEWESALGQMGGHTVETDHQWFSDSGFRQVIGNYTPGQTDPQFFNRAYKIGQTNSAAALATLFPAYGFTGETTQRFADFRANGPVAQWPAGPVELAVGADLREEHHAITPSANLLAGDIVGNGMNQVNARRWLGAVFAEGELPLARNIHLNLAARIDKFRGFAAHLTPRVGLRVDALPTLALRGSWEGGFRAPNLIESANSTIFSFAGNLFDPKRCPQAQKLIADLRSAAAALPASDPNKVLMTARADNLDQLECHGAVAAEQRGTPGLKPETANNASIGIVFKPLANVSISLDYWSISQRHGIAQRSYVEQVRNEDQLTNGSIVRNPVATDTRFSAAERAAYGVTVGPMQLITTSFENGTATKANGIDISAALLRTPTPLGPLDLSLNLTRNLSHREYSAAQGGYRDNTIGHGRTAFFALFSASLQAGAFTHGVNFNYASATTAWAYKTDTFYTPADCASRGWTPTQCKNGSAKNIDYSLAWHAGKQFTLSGYVHNLLRRYQTNSLAGLEAGGGGIVPQNLGDVMGRMVGVRVEYAAK